MRVPVILLLYPGEPRPWEKSDAEDLLFGTRSTAAGSTGSPSLREAYLEYTYGRLEVQGDVFDWYTLSQERIFYEQPFKDDKGMPCAGLCPDQVGGAAAMILEAMKHWDDQIDFSQYDNDGPDGVSNSGDDDGFVDTMFFIQNGRGGECAGGREVFSHYYNFSGWFEQPYETNDEAHGTGHILVNDYVMQPAVRCFGKALIEVGVFAHEFGHALGLPDLYDTDFSSAGVGPWDLMGSGGYGADGSSPEFPSHLSVWSKMEIGLIEPTTLPLCISNVTLPPIETDPVAYKLPITETEYFLIECRLNTRLDLRLPGEGILIWHVDEKVCEEKYEDNTVNDEETHRCVALVEADGQRNLDRPGGRADSGDPFPGTSGRDSWTCDTTPDSRGYDGECAALYITDIGPPTDLGCPIAATRLLSPEPGENLRLLTTTPEIILKFSRALAEEESYKDHLGFTPAAPFTVIATADRKGIGFMAFLSEGTSYQLMSVDTLEDECTGKVEPFSVFMDTGPEPCGGNCCCSQVQCRSESQDVSWVLLFLWAGLVFGKRFRRRRVG